MAPFRPLTEAELGRLDDDELVAYLRAAAAAGEHEHARRALHHLVWGFWDLVEMRLSLRLPAHAVEDETSKVIVRAISSSFAGESVGQFRAWLTTIIKYAVADYYKAGEREPEQVPLHVPGDDGERENLPGRFEADSAGYVEVQALVQQCLDELSEPHRRVVEITVFQDRPAADAAAEVPGITADNAYQIAHRFRERLRALLEEEDR